MQKEMKRHKLLAIIRALSERIIGRRLVLVALWLVYIIASLIILWLVVGPIVGSALALLSEKLDHNNVRSVGLAVGGAALVIGAVVNLPLAILRTNSAQRTSDAADAQAKISSESHITDRFGKAMELLGNAAPEARLGGIYALERIAQDSPKRDHWPIMETLCAFIRERSSISNVHPRATKKKSSILLSRPLTDAEGQRSNDIETAVADPDLSTDVLAALSVVNRRTRHQIEFEKISGHKLDLSGVNFEGTTHPISNFARANLQGSNFANADLGPDADFSDAYLKFINFREASLVRAKFPRACLTGADLESANLKAADLSGAALNGANLRNVNLEGANLAGANLRGADLTNANMSGVKYFNTDLSLTTLVGTVVSNDDLKTIRLGGADLSGYRMTGFDLSECNFGSIKLRNARLDHANFTKSNMKKTQFDGAILTGASFRLADLRSASFNKAKVRNVDFSGAQLNGAKFEESDVRRCDFTDCDLVSASFFKATLRSSNFLNAKLAHAEFKSADLYGIDFRGAKYLASIYINEGTLIEDTRFPPEVKTIQVELSSGKKVKWTLPEKLPTNFVYRVVENSK
jgi:uncharacterized protein YjbI with pentapeptide repeats